jgi:UDP-N-acetylmuramate--alanine ligase
MRIHFSGIAGVGMNPLARLLASRGHEVQGSDRQFDQGGASAVRELLHAEGIQVLPQDGSAITTHLERVVYSAAVEPDTAELRSAKALGIPTIARPGLLAEVVNAAGTGVAIAGTSGKSTVTGMLAWILRQTKTPATILGGAAIAGDGVASGCFQAGPEEGIMVAEACESDGTLVGYQPAIGLIHNVTRDHGELTSLRQQFATFAKQSALLVVNSRCHEALSLAANHPNVRTFGVGPGPCAYPLEMVALGADQAEGLLALPQGELRLALCHPGAHNLENAAAAAVIAIELGLDPRAVADALATFPGVARRFEVVGVSEDGIRVVDDYAHNGDKLRAAITAAQAGGGRVHAVFRPHGYGPARFLRPELQEMLPTLLRPGDSWCYLDIYFAGGSVARDINSQDLANDLANDARIGYASDRGSLALWLSSRALPGDTVLVLGARDPGLPALARGLVEVL